MSDKEIVRLLREDPAEGLHEAMIKYYAYVRAIISRILPGLPEDVEECVEDTFVNIWKQVGKVEQDMRSFKGYLMITARNVGISRYRSLRRGQVLSLDTLDLPGEEDVADTVLGADVTRELQKLILELPEPDKEIFFRKYFLFDSVKRIADHVGLDPVQVKNKLYRGKLKLRKQLEERGVTHEAI